MGGSQRCYLAISLACRSCHSRAPGESLHTASIQDLPPLFGILSDLPPGTASPILILAVMRPLLRVSACPSARPLKAVGGAYGGPGRAPMFGYSGPWTEVSRPPVLDWRTEDVNIGSPLSTKRCRGPQRSLNSAPHISQMGTPSFREGKVGKSTEGRGLSSFLLLYSAPHFPQTLCSNRTGQALGAKAGTEVGSPGFGQVSTPTRGS